MESLNGDMLQPPPHVIDKLLMTCLVPLEPIEPFSCQLCDTLYCSQDSLMKHLTTHVKQEHNDADCGNTKTCTESYVSRNNQINKYKKIKSKDNVDSEAQAPYLSIRDRIIFDSEDTIADGQDSCSEVEKFEMTTLDSYRDDVNTNNEAITFNNCNEETSTPTCDVLKCKENSNKKMYPCYSCHKQFVSQTSLKRHEFNRHRVFPPICKVCGLRYEHPHDLNKHMQTHKEVFMHFCEICLKGFRSKSHLNRHVQIHTEEKCWKCEVCSKMFKFQELLQKHQRVHTNERPFSCNTCNLYFRNCSSLVYHTQKVHVTQDQHPTCALCYKQFINKWDVQKHIYSMHMKTGYRCRICKKQFGHPMLLAKHKHKHNKNTEHKKRVHHCSFCEKSFSTKYHRDRHEISLHKKIYGFECDGCKMKFKRKDHVMCHIRDICRKKKYKCGKCKKVCSKLIVLNRHLKKCKRK